MTSTQTVPMIEIFEKLRILQDILSQKIKLEQQMQDIPKSLVNLEEMDVKLKTEFITLNQDYEKIKSDENECRNNLRKAESSRERAEKKHGYCHHSTRIRGFG